MTTSVAAALLIGAAACGTGATASATHPVSTVTSTAPVPAVLPWSQVDKAGLRKLLRQTGWPGDYAATKTLYDIVAPDCRLSAAGLRALMRDQVRRRGAPDLLVDGMMFVCPRRGMEASKDYTIAWQTVTPIKIKHS